MCGRFTSKYTWQEICDHLSKFLGEPDEKQSALNLQPRYNVAPSQNVPVVRLSEAGFWRIDLLRWGLVPLWAKDLSIGYKLINARAETVAEKPSFRSAFKSRRCLLPADGFYEWKKLAKGKQPYRLTLKGGNPFAFAGLWEYWDGADKGHSELGTIESCTIITTEPNFLAKELHNRMPVILDPADYRTWLQQSGAEMLKPYPAERMDAYPVSTVVNSPRNDTPACIEKAA